MMRTYDKTNFEHTPENAVIGVVGGGVEEGSGTDCTGTSKHDHNPSTPSAPRFKPQSHNKTKII